MVADPKPSHPSELRSSSCPLSSEFSILALTSIQAVEVRASSSRQEAADDTIGTT